jgi:hypothetical protein
MMFVQARSRMLNVVDEFMHESLAIRARCNSIRWMSSTYCELLDERSDWDIFVQAMDRSLSPKPRRNGSQSSAR